MTIDKNRPSAARLPSSLASTSLPLERWSKDMQLAVAEISKLGLQLLDRHRNISDRAAEIATQWKLSERLQEENAALQNVFQILNEILSSIEKARQRMLEPNGNESETLQAMEDCAFEIERGLPRLQPEFLTIRHSALDLLLWERRFAEDTESELPKQYREAHRRLLAYTPVFQPYLEQIQQELLRRSSHTRVSPALQRMLTGVNQYMATVQSARSFVQSVVEPPLELVFNDTEAFDQDWAAIPKDTRAELATELNDCCQQLLYDSAAFQRSVKQIERRLSSDIDVSLYVFIVHGYCIIFTLDEDPVFEQLIFTLLRLVPEGEQQATTEELFDLLSQDLASQ